MQKNNWKGRERPFGLIAFVADQKSPVIPICYNHTYQIDYEKWGVSQDNKFHCGNYISFDSDSYSWSPYVTPNITANIWQSMSFRYKAKLRNGQLVDAYNIFIEQSVSGQSNQFHRRLHVIDVKYQLKELVDYTFSYIFEFIVRLRRDDNTDLGVINYYNFIVEMDASVEVLGFLQTRPDNETHKTLYVLLRTHDDRQIDGRLAIKYCVYSPTISGNECLEKKYKLLIDCSEPKVKATVVAKVTTPKQAEEYSFPLILYLIIGAIVFWLLFVIICIIYYFCSKCKKESEQMSQSSSGLQSSIVKSGNFFSNEKTVKSKSRHSKGE